MLEQATIELLLENILYREMLVKIVEWSWGWVVLYIISVKKTLN